MTGIDPMPELRGRYSTASGAARALRHFAGAGLDEAAVKIAARLGAEEISVLHACRGDCVIADVELPDGTSGAALGLVGANGRSGLFAGPAGLTSVPLALCRRGWRVG